MLDLLTNDDPYFPAASQTFLIGYSDPTDNISLLVTVSYLPPGVRVPVTLHGLESYFATDPSITIEESDTSVREEVPYLLAKESEDYFVLSWGAKDGNTIFTVMATRESDREAFIREVVSALQNSGGPAAMEAPNSVDREPSLSGMDEAVLFELLVETPFSDDELPLGFSGATVEESAPFPTGTGSFVSFQFRHGPATKQRIHYWLYPTAADAQREYLAHPTYMTQQGWIATPMTVLGYPATEIAIPDHVGAAVAAVYVLVENVVVLSSTRTLQRPHDLADVKAYSFLLAEAGVQHLERVVADGPSTANGPRQPSSDTDLTAFLPLQHEVPSDLQHVGDRSRSLAEVAVNYTDPTATERLFISLGWSGNVTRSYEGTGWSSGVTSVYVSIHRFSSARNAEQALYYSLEDQAISTGAWEIPVVPLAATTQALATSSDVTIYAQEGDVVIRLTVAAPNGGPLPTAELIMQSMLARAS